MNFRRRGMALLTVLLLSTLLLMLGITFLEYLEIDYRLAAQQERRQQAYFLAAAGLAYAHTHTDVLHAAGGGATVTQQLPPNDPDHSFEVSVDAQGRVRSRGIVRNPFRILAQHTLVVEPGSSAAEASMQP